jgi:nitrous oxidase accessory protein
MRPAHSVLTLAAGAALGVLPGPTAALGVLPGPTAAQDTLTVSPAGPYTTIGSAVRAARPGTIVLVRSGIYREPTIVLDKPIELLGTGAPVLDGGNEREILQVIADSVTVRGLVLRNTGSSYLVDRAAIKVMDVTGCVIEKNRIENAFFGIYMGRVSDCRVAGNVIVSNAASETTAGNGIHLWTVDRVEITDNYIRGHRDGIYFEFTSSAIVRRNSSVRNLRYGLHFMYSDNCSYVENVFASNLAGVAVMYSKSVRMEGNRFADSWGGASYGLLLKEIYDPVIVGNTFFRNTVGIVADGAVRIQAADNTFERNGWGVRLLASTYDGRFERNDFIGNTFDVTTNSFNIQNRFHENYFDSYRAYDLDRDGFGDVPHRPVRLFAVLVERSPQAVLLLRSFLVGVLDVAERMIPGVTPSNLADGSPAMRRWR